MEPGNLTARELGLLQANPRCERARRRPSGDSIGLVGGFSDLPVYASTSPYGLRGVNLLNGLCVMPVIFELIALSALGTPRLL